MYYVINTFFQYLLIKWLKVQLIKHSDVYISEYEHSLFSTYIVNQTQIFSLLKQLLQFPNFSSQKLFVTKLRLWETKFCLVTASTFTAANLLLLNRTNTCVCVHVCNGQRKLKLARQLDWEKNRPKCSPTHFWQNKCMTLTVENLPTNVGYFCNFQTTAQSR
jgi:hypothetical protein